MAISVDISRANPGCFLFLIDQSGSMGMTLGGQPGLRKSGGAADALNHILDAISQRCSQGMDVRDYFDVGIIAYTTDRRGNADLRAILPGASLEDPFLKISEVVEAADVEERQVKESDGAGGLVEVARKFPVWLRPVASYGTPMCEALNMSVEAVEDWIDDHPESYPPMVIHVTDGMASDGNPEPIAQKLMALETEGGSVLLYNAHLSEMSTTPVQYPASESDLPPDEFAALLFRMSSVFPEPMREMAASMGLPVQEGSRGYVYNADMVALVQFLDIGTRAASNLR